MKRTYLAAGLAAVAVGAAVAVPGAVTAPPALQLVRAEGLTTKVTLITGDEVEVVDGRVHARAAEGRERVGFRSFKDIRGDLHVVPLDVQHRITTGELDERLFDISLLTRFGYDDAASSTTPLIVERRALGAVRVQAADTQALPSIGAHAVEADKSGGAWAGAPGQGRIWLDGKVTASLDRSAVQVGAPAAWAKGFTGEGVTVAVLDTGVDETHPDLAGAVVESKNFTTNPTTDDLVGHGTHVAATITGAGEHQGIAPGAKIVNGKVLMDEGGGRESDIIAGMEWAATKAKIINMSLGSSWPDEGTDPMSLALDRISRETGALFVVAAGNTGGVVGSPAAADTALTVGAVDRDDTLATFSSRGPRWTNNAVKPDITAPGVGIVAAKAKHGEIGDPVDDGHVALTGTSMAAPHVAGAAAILAAQHPEWKAEELKAALMNSARPNPALSVYEQGAGRLDVDRAASATISTDQGSLSLGTAQWPHHDDTPITRKITYRNTGTTDVTLDLSVADVKPAADGLFSVSPATLTIPAGGTADATVTADTRASVADGIYGAAVVASNGVRVTVGVVKEVESYDVKLTFLDHNGQPTRDYVYRFVNLDQQEAFTRHDPSGTLVQRLPKGRFFFDTSINTPTGDRIRTTGLTEPAFEVTGPAEIVFDARQASEPSIGVEREDAATVKGALASSARTAWGETGNGWYSSSYNTILTRPSATSWPDFEFHQEAVLARPDGQGAFAGSPYQYHVRVSEKGRVPENLRPRVKDDDLARVDSITHARVPGSIGRVDDGASGPLPLKLEEYYTPGVAWAGSVGEFTEGSRYPDLGTQSSVVPRVFQLGETVTEHRNSAVYGPGVPHDPQFVRYAARVGNQLLVDVPLHSAQGMNGRTSATGRTTVTVDGEVVLDRPVPGFVNIPTAPRQRKRYQVHTEATQDSVSSRITADWSFTSEFVPGEELRPVPVLAVRFTPLLDEHNRAGRELTVPVTVERNGTGTVTDVETLTVQVSYDEGATWSPVPLSRAGDGWDMTLTHPAGAENVSFQASAADSASEVRQTIIRAYDLK